MTFGSPVVTNILLIAILVVLLVPGL